MQRCSRESLQAAADALAKALEAADSTQMTLAAGATDAENMKASTFTDGIWKSAVEIAFRRDLLDAESCETFSEIIVTAGHKYVIGARLKVADGQVAEVDALVTDEGDWLFDADGYFKYSKAEDWSVIPEADRDTRETLIAAANAYFDLFNDKTTEVPWNTPCTPRRRPAQHRYQVRHGRPDRHHLREQAFRGRSRSGYGRRHGALRRRGRPA